MPAFTSFLNLYKPGGGSSGLILPDEVVDIDRINNNMDAIDSFASSWGLAARQTRDFTGPAASRASFVPSPRLGDFYQDTDGSQTLWWYNGTAWVRYFYTNALGTARNNSNTAQTGIVGTAVALTSISLGITLPEVRNLRFKFAAKIFASVVDTVANFTIRDGATDIFNFAVNANSSVSAANTSNALYYEVLLPSVSAATHTYTVVCNRAAGTGAITVTHDSLYPTYLSVEAY